ncbi:MAG: DUF1549 domain-containing protein, partial [Candidatus Poribacteria bacterium]|nr:DUF1549 domain-containing protein [Candidatus Poribacteria bacterium]
MLPRIPLRAAAAMGFVSWMIAVAWAVQNAYGVERRLSFDRDIRVILSDKCFACHGPDENQRQANLRLDTKEGAFSERYGLKVITPGDLENSLLAMRVTSDEPTVKMPPPHANRQLTRAEIDKITKWIEQGAEWEEHWSYIPPERTKEPEVLNDKWIANAIDRFILSRLESQEIAPSPEADKRTLIRRVSFDLIGLPPTAAEVEAYVSDKSPDAYERLVDRLLSSPRYGERMATHWLDLTRYADTSGYHSDENVSVWPYRDYVIRAFNDNMPYDRFVRENLAGDLFPSA